MPDKIFKHQNADTLWLLFLIAVGSALSISMATTLFDISVLLSGILCVGLIAIGRREGYLFGLYNSLTYSVLAYGNGLYGEVYLNLLFFVPTGIIGFLMWRKHSLNNRTVVMRSMDWRSRGIVAIICIACTLILGVILGLNANQNTPFIDATTNVLSIVATFLMMWRYKEQWLLYITLNVVSIIMWALRALNGGEAGDMMVLMWSLFLVNAIFGYWRWHTGSKQSFSNGSSLTDGQAACDAA
ncbi:MAG: nicotinamide riboside transporter PnuC [Alcanivoracaceae bacterium]|nr:nicotinamide riboside transporter PnuC [Alcanivoracaceae bacterium]